MSNREDTSQVVHLRLPKELHRKVRIAGAEDASTMSEIIAAALRSWLKQRDEQRAA